MYGKRKIHNRKTTNNHITSISLQNAIITEEDENRVEQKDHSLRGEEVHEHRGLLGGHESRAGIA